jgi:4-diphosphocytidyl-2-C-methyl-D-erythritol kinase
LARGIGEALTPVSLPPMWIAVMVPSVAVATAIVFAAPELTRNSPSVKMDVFSEGYGCNDLEKVASARFPEIIEALEYLRARSPAARMTGSGSCVFAPFAQEAEACAAVAAKPPRMRGFVARTLARHPLAEFARG